MRTRTYYTIRTIVRVAFWGGLAGLSALAITTITDDGKTDCNLTINSDFTWDVRDYTNRYPTQPVHDCSIDPIMQLNADGTWTWTEEE